MKYKVGDKVKIRSLDWYKANKKKKGNIPFYRNSTYTMSYYCGKIAKIINVKDKSYSINLDNGLYSWPDEMFEENINDMETKEIIIPQGWEIDKVEGNKVILKESKKELPKTWEECITKVKDLECIDSNGDIDEVDFNFGIIYDHVNDIPKGLGKPVLALMQLLVCREVYRQGWKPDWTNTNENKYCIINNFNKIETSINASISKVLSFQSEEVKDKFLENFKDLIKEAKELI